MSGDTFGARSTLDVGGQSYEIFRLAALQDAYDVARLPYTLRILRLPDLTVQAGLQYAQDQRF